MPFGPTGKIMKRSEENLPDNLQNQTYGRDNKEDLLKAGPYVIVHLLKAKTRLKAGPYVIAHRRY